MAVKAVVEALLRDRKLDRTLTSSLPDRLGEDAVAPFDADALDRGLAGGLPRGQVSEVVGPSSSGRTSVAWAALAAATRRGESVALVDTFDRFDPPSAHACGIDLSRLLWVRGQAVSKTAGAIDPAWLPGVRAVNGPGTFLERVIDRAIKSLNLVVQSGVCTLVVIDLIDIPAAALRRLPASTWFRVERAIEGSDTTVLILAAQPVARSAGGRSIAMESVGNREPGTGNRKSGVGSRESGTGNGESGAGNGERGTGNQKGTPVPGSRFPVPDVIEKGPPVPGSRLPVPDMIWKVPDVVWKGNHDRTRRIAGVRARAQVNAARWSHAQSVDLETLVINAL